MSRFRRIWQEGQLTPQPCRVLGGEVIYLSYGDLVCRPSGEQNGWADDPPVVLRLKASILSGAHAFAPVDTGSLAAGRMRWIPSGMRAQLGRRFGVRDRGGRHLRHWIDQEFGGDAAYVRRASVNRGAAPDEVAVIRRLCADAARADADGGRGDDLRVMSQIECHLRRPIRLDESLAGLYLPQEAGSLAKEAARRGVVVVRTYSGQPDRGRLPSDLADMVRRDLWLGLHLA